MRPARSRRVQAQRKFAQGAYVPPNVTTVVAVDTRRDTTQDARNVTINHMPATSLLDVVSLQSLTSQPVVLIERLRGRHLARDVPPSPLAETSQPQPLKSTIKKIAEPPKIHATRNNRLECKRVHAMSLRSRRLSKLELNKLVAQNSVLRRKTPSKRKIYSSDEDEPLIFQKTRKKGSTAATSSIKPREIVSKVKSIKSSEAPRKTITKVLKTNSVSSKRIKQSGPLKKTPLKRSPRKKRIRNDCTAKQPAEISVPTVKAKCLRSKQDNLVNKAALDVSLARGDAIAPDGPVAPHDLVTPKDETNPPYGLQVSVVKDESVNNPEDFSDQSEPPMTEEELARMDEALAVLNDLPDIDKVSFCGSDDESAAQDIDLVEEAKIEVPLVQSNDMPNQAEYRLSESPEDFPALVYGSDASNDEPSLRDEPTVQKVQNKAVPLTQTTDHYERQLSYSPEPGPSGMQFQKNNPDMDLNYDHCSNSSDSQRITSHFQLYSQKIPPPGGVSFEIPLIRELQTRNCVVSTACTTEQGLMNTSKGQLNSRNGLPYTKTPIAGNSSAQDAQVAVPENELERQESGTKDVEMSIEKRTVTDDKDDSHNVSKSGVNCDKQHDGKEPMQDKQSDSNIQISQTVNSESANGNPEARRMSISSDSTETSTTSTTPEHEKVHRSRSEKNKSANEKLNATRRRIAEAKELEELIRQAREADILRIEQQKQIEIARIMAEKEDCEAEISSLLLRFVSIQKDKEKEFDRRIVQIKDTMTAEWEAYHRMIDEVDTMAETLDNEKDAKSMPLDNSNLDEEPDTSESAPEGGTLEDAPVYYPTKEEFQDPITFYEKIYPEMIKYGVCKVVPPPGWRPPSEVHGDIRFDVMNQYISRLFSRWGPAARELSAIKLCLHHQNINFVRPPQIDGVEINLSKLYYHVQRLGGLETVINKKRWAKVAEDMKFRGGHYERRLDPIYMKYLLPYDTLSHQERQEIMHRVEIAWNKKNQKLLDRAMNPLYRQKRMLGLMDSSDDEGEEEDTKFALKTAEDCIVKGHLMQHSRFKKGSEAAGRPALEQIEEQYWRLVTSGTEHACVHTAAIDTGTEGHGFTTKVEPYASHPWNPKKVIDNPRNVLRYLGPVVGVTLPTLLLGMLFSTSCWHKDPHAVAWYEYQSVGPTRIWYGIPADQADNFRKAVETLSPTSCQNKSLWLSSEITMIPPSVLRDHNVSLTRVTQNEREFILAFPNAYSCCISTGYTESESVYFAPPSWLDCLWKVFKEARESCEPTMFSMEHLLYNIGCDSQPVLDILKRAQPLYDQMLREEVTNRQMLQERGLTFVQELISARENNQASSTYRARPQEECDYCRASLFLSKVKGLPAKNSVLCLEHTLTLLDVERYKKTDVKQLQVLVHVSVRELNKVHDEMKRHLRNKT